jgi:hypothetical protein
VETVVGELHTLRSTLYTSRCLASAEGLRERESQSALSVTQSDTTSPFFDRDGG